jgi:general stress protein 26
VKVERSLRALALIISLRRIVTMAAPIPKPIDPAQLPELARATMRGAKFPMLGSLDGDQARVRPVSPVRTDGFTVYVANLRSYHKTGEIAANPKVELCYLDSDHNQVRITGVAEMVADRALLDEIWQTNPLLRSYLGTPDNPALIVYRITPHQVRYMREWALEYFEVPIA